MCGGLEVVLLWQPALCRRQSAGSIQIRNRQAGQGRQGAGFDTRQPITRFTTAGRKQMITVYGIRN